MPPQKDADLLQTTYGVNSKASTYSIESEENKNLKVLQNQARVATD